MLSKKNRLKSKHRKISILMNTRMKINEVKAIVITDVNWYMCKKVNLIRFDNFFLVTFERKTNCNGCKVLSMKNSVIYLLKKNLALLKARKSQKCFFFLPSILPQKPTKSRFKNSSLLVLWPKIWFIFNFLIEVSFPFFHWFYSFILLAYILVL